MMVYLYKVIPLVIKCTHDLSTEVLNVARWLFLTALLYNFDTSLANYRNLGILYVSAFQLLKKVCSFFVRFFFLLWS